MASIQSLAENRSSPISVSRVWQVSFDREDASSVAPDAGAVCDSLTIARAVTSIIVSPGEMVAWSPVLEENNTAALDSVSLALTPRDHTICIHHTRGIARREVASVNITCHARIGQDFLVISVLVCVKRTKCPAGSKLSKFFQQQKQTVTMNLPQSPFWITARHGAARLDRWVEGCRHLCRTAILIVK